jgi:hypothetical protein
MVAASVPAVTVVIVKSMTVDASAFRPSRPENTNDALAVRRPGRGRGREG